MTITDTEWVAEATGFELEGSRYGGYWGVVEAPHGIVSVDQSANWTGLPWGLVMRYVCAGRLYQRTIKRNEPYSRRYVVTLAQRFAQDRFAEWLDELEG